MASLRPYCTGARRSVNSFEASRSRPIPMVAGPAAVPSLRFHRSPMSKIQQGTVSGTIRGGGLSWRKHVQSYAKAFPTESFRIPPSLYLIMGELFRSMQRPEWLGAKAFLGSFPS